MVNSYLNYLNILNSVNLSLICIFKNAQRYAEMEVRFFKLLLRDE